MSDVLDENAFQTKAPWGKTIRVVPLYIAKEQQQLAHERGMSLGRATHEHEWIHTYTAPVNHRPVAVRQCVRCGLVESRL